MESLKRDWKLFRERIGKWQEAYMERLTKEYIELLSGFESASERFWKLEERIKKDKRNPGVIISLGKSNMLYDMVALVNYGVITAEDLNEFSAELKEEVNFYLKSVD